MYFFRFEKPPVPGNNQSVGPFDKHRRATQVNDRHGIWKPQFVCACMKFFMQEHAGLHLHCCEIRSATLARSESDRISADLEYLAYQLACFFFVNGSDLGSVKRRGQLPFTGNRSFDAIGSHCWCREH